MQFTDLNLLPELLSALSEKGYTVPTPIQQQAIPAVMQGRDLMAAAQTGTGKTAGFTLPLLHRLALGFREGRKVQSNHVRALILTPTRELAAQVAENVALYGKNLPLRSTVVFGGVKINPQMMALRKGADILVATPGRLLDLYSQNAVKFGQLEVLVLDEADRMLDMGFIHDIKKVLALLPKNRQNLLFSATFSDDIRKLAKGLVNDPLEVSVTPPNTTAERVEQLVYSVDKNRKAPLLTQLINDNNWQQVLVFTKTKHMANRLSLHLQNAGISALPIHGNKSQNARTKALSDFKSGEIRVLVATDIAARGLDIDQLPQVVNFELPNVAEDYVHRIGRTGRAGAAGHAVSMVCADEFKELSGIERLIQQVLPRAIASGFEPTHALAESKLNTKPYKPKKPKQPKEYNDAAAPSADKPFGERPGRPQGQRPQGQRPARPDGEQGQRPARAPRPQGDRPQGQRPARPDGEQGQRPARAPRPQGDRPQGQRPARPDGEQGQRPARAPRPQGDRTQGQRPARPDGEQGQRPARAPRPQGDRPQGQRPPRRNNDN